LGIAFPGPERRVRTRLEEWHGVPLVLGYVQFDYYGGAIVRYDDVGNHACLACVAIARHQDLSKVGGDGLLSLQIRPAIAVTLDRDRNDAADLERGSIVGKS